MIPAFAGSDHFGTYHGEVNASISANANALRAMTLEVSNERLHGTEIMKVANYICTTWLKADMFPEDKWVRQTPHARSQNTESPELTREEYLPILSFDAHCLRTEYALEGLG